MDRASIGTWKVVFLGALVAMAIVAFHVGPSLLVDIVAADVAFVSNSERPAKWKGDISNLQRGSYFVSAGRPRGHCRIEIDSRLVSANYNEPGLPRDQLLIGASFLITESISPKEIEIICEYQRGFPLQFTTRPFVAHASTGKVLHFWFAFTQTIMGPFVSLLLLMMFVQVWLTRSFSGAFDVGKELNERTKAVYVFSFFAFLYSLSLAHWTRLWLDPYQATAVHIALRSLYAFALAFVWSTYGVRSATQLLLHALHFVVVVAVAFAAPAQLVTVYKFGFIFFFASSAFSVWMLVRNNFSSAARLSAILAFACTVVLPIDFCATFVWQKENVSPALLAVLCLGVLFVRIQEEASHERAEAVSKQLVDLFSANMNLVDLIKSVAQLAGKASRFARTSAYVDAQLCGAAEGAGKAFVRVYEYGYNDAGRPDQQLPYSNSLVFSEGAGRLMKQALDSQKVIVDRGERDGAWFVIIPIGPSVCINISDHSQSRRAFVEGRLRVLELLLPALRRLEDRISEHAIKLCLGLERLRQKHGYTTLSRQIASLFVDVDKYSSLSTEFGDSFSRFVNDVYMPAMVKKVGVWAVPEYMRGDEIYFVSLPDLLPEGVPLDEALSKVIVAIDDFMQNEGRTLCANAGYPALSVKMGAAIGPGSVICDAIKVRTAGGAINQAKRLMDYADAGQILFRSDPAEGCANLPGFEAGPSMTVVQKRDIFIARQLKRIIRDERIAGATTGAGRLPRATDLAETWDHDFTKRKRIIGGEG